MSHLSPRAAELVRSLLTRPGLAGRLFGRRFDPAVLAELQSLDELVVAPLLLPFVVDGDAETRDRVAALIRSLLASATPLRILELDDASRSGRWYAGVDASDWYFTSPSYVGQLAARRDPIALLGVASMHWSGYVREAALAALDALPGDGVLPYLLVRLNDWVTPVAERARAAAMRRVGNSPELWVTHLPLLARLEETTRRQHRPILDAVFAFLRQSESRAALEAGFLSADRTTRRLSFRLARESAGPDLARMVARALECDDPIVRFEAWRDASRRLDTQSLAPLLDATERDTFVPVRRDGLLLAAERFPGTAEERARRALVDRSASLRETARFVLTKLDPTLQVAEVYRAHLRSESYVEIVVALAGLAETGVEQDAALVRPLLTHRRSAVRAQAVRALGRLNADAHGEAFISALSDVSPRVSRAARDVLERNPYLVDLAAINAAVRELPHVHGRLHALTLGQSLGKWPSLIVYLEAAGHAEAALAREAQERLTRWLQGANRRYTAPRPAELTAIRELLGRSDESLDDQTRRLIQFHLEPWLGNT